MNWREDDNLLFVYLVTSVVTLVADPDESAGSDIGVADDTLPVTLLTQSTCSSKKSNYPLYFLSEATVTTYLWQLLPAFCKISNLDDAWPWLVLLFSYLSAINNQCVNCSCSSNWISQETFCVTTLSSSLRGWLLPTPFCADCFDAY